MPSKPPVSFPPIPGRAVPMAAIKKRTGNSRPNSGHCISVKCHAVAHGPNIKIVRILAVALPAIFALTSCEIMPAPVRDGCYRFSDGSPLFKVVGKQGFALSKNAEVKTFQIGGWLELSQKTVAITPAFYLPGLPAGDPRRGDTMPIPTIAYSTFAFDPKRSAFEVPIAAWGEQEVKLGAPC